MSEHQFFLMNNFPLEAHARHTRMQWPSLGWHTQSQVSTELMEHRNDVPEANGPPKLRAIPAQCSGIPAHTRRSGVLDRVFYAPFASEPELHREKLESEKDQSS